MKTLFYLILVSSLVLATYADDDEDSCSDSSIVTIDDGDLVEIRRNLSLKIYESVDDLDQNSQGLLNCLRLLIDSNNEYQRNIGYFVATWIYAFQDHLDHVCFCPLAQMINASVSGVPEDLISAIDAEKDFERVFSLFRQQNSIDASDCNSPSVISNVIFKDCWNFGYSYEINNLWASRVSVLEPWTECFDVVQNSYYSNVVKDKFIALLLSYSITGQMENFLNKYPIGLSLQMTSLEFSCSIPECCSSRLQLIESLRDHTTLAAVEILEELKPEPVVICTDVSVGEDKEQIKKELSLKIYGLPVEHCNNDTLLAIEYLRELVDSEDCYQRNIAFYVAGWWAAFKDYFHSIPVPAFCQMAQLINASVSGNIDEIKSALDAAKEFEDTFSLYRYENSFKAAGCPKPCVLPDSDCKSCWGNGFVYEVDILWQDRGHVLPPELLDIIYKLYKSRSIANKMLALFISYSITEQMQCFFDQYPIQLSLMATALEFDRVLEVECCSRRLNVLDNVKNETTLAAQFVLGNIKPKTIEETCPDVVIDEDLVQVQRELTLKIYDIPFEHANEKTHEIINYLQQLAFSEDPLHRLISYNVAPWPSVFADHIDTLPAFCPFARLINASLYEDRDEMRAAVESNEQFTNVLSLYRQENSNKISGCNATSCLSDIDCGSCWANGFVYEIDLLWVKRGYVLPPHFRNIVRQLYKSHLILNKIIAIFISVNIIEQNCMLYPSANALKFTSMEFTCEIPECCERRLENFEKQRAIVVSEAMDILDCLKPECVCPQINIEDPGAVQKSLTKAILFSTPYPLSKTGESVIDTLIAMSICDDPAQRGMAYLASFLYGPLSKSVNELPDVCALAALVNETVLYHIDRRRSKIKNAIDDFSRMKDYIHSLNYQMAITASGCEPLEAIAYSLEMPSSGCYCDGYVYDIKKIWTMRKNDVPRGLGNKVQELYKSKNRLEKLLALSISVAITDTLIDGWEEYDQVSSYRYFALGVSEPIPKCCCAGRLKEIADSQQNSISVSNNGLDQLKLTFCSR